MERYFEMNDKIWLTEVISNALKKSEFADYPLSLHDLTLIPIKPDGAVVLEFDDRERNLFWRIFNSAAPDRKGVQSTYFHFKTFEIGKKILQTGLIQASNLFSNRYNDYAEAEEFVRRYGGAAPLIPDGYTNPGLLKPENRFIDKLRENTCILCFTSSFKDPRFWRNYVNDGNGICFEFLYDLRPNRTLMINDVVPTSEKSALHLYQLREVCYDNGYMFDFINEISFHIFDRTRCVLKIPGLPEMARSYKRARYSWERETRLIFDLKTIEQFGFSSFKTDAERISDGNERRFVVLPIHNFKLGTNYYSPFSLTLKSVICGYNISPRSEEWNEIQKLCDQYYGIPVRSVLHEM